MFLSTGWTAQRTTASHFQFTSAASQKLSLQNGAIDPACAEYLWQGQHVEQQLILSDTTLSISGAGWEGKNNSGFLRPSKISTYFSIKMF